MRRALQSGRMSQTIRGTQSTGSVTVTRRGSECQSNRVCNQAQPSPLSLVSRQNATLGILRCRMPRLGIIAVSRYAVSRNGNAGFSAGRFAIRSTAAAILADCHSVLSECRGKAEVGMRVAGGQWNPRSVIFSAVHSSRQSCLHYPIAGLSRRQQGTACQWSLQQGNERGTSTARALSKKHELSAVQAHLEVVVSVVRNEWSARRTEHKALTEHGATEHDRPCCPANEHVMCTNVSSALIALTKENRVSRVECRPPRTPGIWPMLGSHKSAAMA